MFLVAVALVVLFLLYGLYPFIDWKMTRLVEDEWRDAMNPHWRTVTLLDGTRHRGGGIMGRLVRGKPQYRLQTEAERENPADHF